MSFMLGGVRRCVAIAVALAAMQRGAHAEPTVESAKTALDNSDYPGARQQLIAILARGDHNAAELAEMYRMLGVAAAALGDNDASIDAFSRCLALDPKTTLPRGTSPKITKPFDTAKAKVNERLEIKAETKSDPPAVVIQSLHDPVGMIVRYRVTVRVDGTVRPPIEKPAAEEMEISVPSGARVDVWVAALDSNGNRLTEVGSAEVPLVIVGTGGGSKVVTPTPAKTKPVKAPGSLTPPYERPLYLQWWVWGSATLVAAAGTGYFGMRAIDGRDSLQKMTAENPRWDVFQDTIATTRRDVLITNIGFGVTGALGVTAAILFVTRPHASVAPMSVEHGAGVAMKGRF
jgi:hypothetical protein